MASAIRRASADLDGDALSRFRSAPWRFDVWQAGAILEAWKGRMDWGVPASDSIPAGVVRGVAFPEGGAPRLDVNLLGLAGMDGPLPPHVALLVRERMRAGDPAFQEFLDLFHNRNCGLTACRRLTPSPRSWRRFPAFPIRESGRGMCPCPARWLGGETCPPRCSGPARPYGPGSRDPRRGWKSW